MDERQKFHATKYETPQMTQYTSARESAYMVSGRRSAPSTLPDAALVGLRVHVLNIIDRVYLAARRSAGREAVLAKDGS